MRKTFLSILFGLFLPAALSQQMVMESNSQDVSGTTQTYVHLDSAVSPCTATTGYPGSTSISCTLSSVTAGDMLLCGTDFGDEGENIKFSDSLNGTWSAINYGWSNASYHQSLGLWGIPNSAAGSALITMSFSFSRDSEGMICWAVKNARTTAFVDPDFAGFIDEAATTTTPALSSSLTPSGNGELLANVLSLGYNTTASAGTGFTELSATDPIDHLASSYWAQTTAQASTCPWSTSPADAYGLACTGILPSSASAGAIPYQYRVVTFGDIGTTAPTLSTLINSASGGLDGWMGGEIDAGTILNGFCNGDTTPWALTNINSDITGTTSGPTNLLATPLWLPRFQAAYTGNSAYNLQFTTGTANDALCMNITPVQTSMKYGYYVQWNIPSTDTSGHAYIFGGVQTASNYGVAAAELVSGGSSTTLQLFTTGNSNQTLGTVTSGTPYWITGQYTAGGSDELSIYSGCPSSCTLEGSASATDTVSSTTYASFFLGSYVGTTQTSGYDIWFRNVKFCASYPCMP